MAVDAVIETAGNLTVTTNAGDRGVELGDTPAVTDVLQLDATELANLRAGILAIGSSTNNDSEGGAFLGGGSRFSSLTQPL